MSKYAVMLDIGGTQTLCIQKTVHAYRARAISTLLAKNGNTVRDFLGTNWSAMMNTGGSVHVRISSSIREIERIPNWPKRKDLLAACREAELSTPHDAIVIEGEWRRAS